jgi:chromosome segregation ATPase
VVREIRAQRGVLIVRGAIEETLTYTIRNVDERAKTLIIEHPARPDYKLLNQKPAETTPAAYRFEVKLAPKAEEKFAVSEERVFDNRVSVISQTPDALAAYLENKALSAAGRKQLETILDRKRQIAEAGNAIKQAEAETGEIAKDQERLRQNILSLNQVSGQQEQVQRYARDLAGREARLAALRDQLGEQRKKKAALEAELNSLIEKMEF